MTKDDVSNHHSARERQGDVLIVKGAQFVCRILVVEPNQPQQFREYILFPPRKTHRRLKSEIIKIIRRGANYSSGQAKNVRRKLPFKVVFEFNLCRGKFTQLSIDVNTTQQQTELSDRHTKLGDNPQDYFRFLYPHHHDQHWASGQGEEPLPPGARPELRRGAALAVCPAARPVRGLRDHASIISGHQHQVRSLTSSQI